MAEQEDNNGLLVLAPLSIAAMLSLVAIVLELASARNLSGSTRTFHYIFTDATVFWVPGSWWRRFIPFITRICFGSAIH